VFVVLLVDLAEEVGGSGQVLGDVEEFGELLAGFLVALLAGRNALVGL